jgi:hypothetical protein
VQPANRDDRTPGGAYGERRVLLVALPQPGEEVGDVLRTDVADLDPPGRR